MLAGVTASSACRQSRNLDQFRHEFPWSQSLVLTGSD